MVSACYVKCWIKRDFYLRTTLMLYVSEKFNERVFVESECEWYLLLYTNEISQLRIVLFTIVLRVYDVKH